jgi:hypothetical protein
MKGYKMSYTNRDIYGMYKTNDGSGPGPALMGANTLIGDKVHNQQEEHLGDIKEIMLDMRTGKVAYAVLSFGGVFSIGENCSPCLGLPSSSTPTKNASFSMSAKHALKMHLASIPKIGRTWLI